ATQSDACTVGRVRVAGPPQQLLRPVQHEIRVAGELVQRVEVAADPLDGLQRVAEPTERIHLQVGHAGWSAVVTIGSVGHAVLLMPGARTSPVPETRHTRSTLP